MYFIFAHAQRLLQAAHVVVPLVVALAVDAVPARAGMRVEGDASAVRIIADRAPISDVLNVLRTRFNVRYETMIKLETVLTGTYSGPVEEVLPRVLTGFNYIITKKDGVFTVVVVGRPGDATVPAEATQTAPLPASTSVTSKWRSSNVK